MNELVVPLAFAGLEVNGHQRFAEQVVAKAMTAVVIGSGRFHGQIHQTEVRIGRHLGPDAGIAVEIGGVVFPRVITKLAFERDGVEGPDDLARLHVEGADQTLGVVVGVDGHAFFEGGAHHDGVFHNQRRGVKTGFTGYQIDLLIGTGDHADFEIDYTFGAEAGDWLTGVSVEFQQLIAHADPDDAVIAFTVGPVGNAATGELTGRVDGALAFLKYVDPVHFACLRVERDYGFAVAAGGIDHAAHHQRRAFQFVFRAGTHVVCFETPRYFKVVEVGGINLIEGQVFAPPDVRSVPGPFAGFHIPAS